MGSAFMPAPESPPSEVKARLRKPRCAASASASGIGNPAANGEESSASDGTQGESIAPALPTAPKESAADISLPATDAAAGPAGAANRSTSSDSAEGGGGDSGAPAASSRLTVAATATAGAADAAAGGGGTYPGAPGRRMAAPRESYRAAGVGAGAGAGSGGASSGVSSREAHLFSP